MFREYALRILLSILISGVLTAIIDTAAAFSLHSLKSGVFCLIFAAAAVAGIFLPIPSAALLWVLIGLIAFCLLAAALLQLQWKLFSVHSAYKETDNGKTAFYGGRRVMLIVPHQDDDINLFGGVFEQYKKYGSELFVVFTTAGDFSTEGAIRMNEALKVAASCGVPHDHVIFLGYGDQYAKDGPNIYNAEPGRVVTSAAGKKQTYGLAGHPCFNEGRAYTSENMLSDIKSVILEIMPDTLYCVDYDSNADHRCASLMFDRAMGQILKERSEYRPLVYKGFAYCTSWYALDDFYCENMRSTRNKYPGEHMEETNVFNWNNRFRLPVCASSLARSLLNCKVYKQMLGYATQAVKRHATMMINGDRVFWRRQCTSLTYSASVEASSGDAWRLNDFMLLDSTDVLDVQHKPFDGTWIPDAEDKVKEARVAFEEPAALEYICLYENPSPEHNVFNALITFDDGACVETGELDHSGCATRIYVNKHSVRGFAVKLTETFGSNAGLTEIEAYGPQPEDEPRYIKLCDNNDDFVYDYYTERNGRISLVLHVNGCAPAPAPENYSLSCSNDKCSVEFGKDIIVRIPRGESCVLSIESKDGTYGDSVVISNPNAYKRFWPMLEGRKYLLKCSLGRFAGYRLAKAAAGRLRRVFGKTFRSRSA